MSVLELVTNVFADNKDREHEYKEKEGGKREKKKKRKKKETEKGEFEYSPCKIQSIPFFFIFFFIVQYHTVLCYVERKGILAALECKF